MTDLVHKTVNSIFDDLWSDTFGPPPGSYPSYPVSDFYVDTDTEDMVLEFALAGFSRDDVEVMLDGYKMTISGRKEKENTDNRKYFNKRIAYRSFSNSYIIPSVYDIDDVDISLKDGILKILFKKKEKEKSRKLEIR